MSNNFHHFDPYEMMTQMESHIAIISRNALEIVKAHNGLQHQLELVTRRVNEQQQEILELRQDLDRITNYNNIISSSG